MLNCIHCKRGYCRMHGVKERNRKKYMIFVTKYGFRSDIDDVLVNFITTIYPDLNNNITITVSIAKMQISKEKIKKKLRPKKKIKNILW